MRHPGRAYRSFGIALVGMLVLACAPTANPSVATAAASGHVAGFWLGVWHGAICWITFAISLFSSKVTIYEAHNSGAWYNFGYLLGASIAMGGSGRAAARRERLRRERNR